MRIRHYGFLANRCRVERLRTIRAAIDAPTPESDEDTTRTRSPDAPTAAEPCPRCQSGVLRLMMTLAPTRLDGG